MSLLLRSYSGQSNLAQMVRVVWSPSMPPLVGDGANDVQSMVPCRIDHSLVPWAAVVFDFDSGVKARADCGPDSEGTPRQAGATVQGSVGRELGSTEDNVVCSRAVSQYCAQVGSDSMDVLGAAGIGDVSGA
jgi:hypothetical protein